MPLKKLLYVKITKNIHGEVHCDIIDSCEISDENYSRLIKKWKKQKRNSVDDNYVILETVYGDDVPVVEQPELKCGRHDIRKNKKHA